MPMPLTVSCSSKSRLVLPPWFLPFWYLLTRVVPGKFQKSSKTIVCVWCVDQVLHGSSCVPQVVVGGIMFNVDIDNRSNFPSERSFHTFKKQRFADSLSAMFCILTWSTSVEWWWFQNKLYLKLLVFIYILMPLIFIDIIIINSFLATALL